MKGPKIVEVLYKEHASTSEPHNKEHASTSEPHKLNQLSMGTFRIVSPCKTLPRGCAVPNNGSGCIHVVV